MAQKEKTTAISITALERVILDIALERHKSELEKVLKKARFLGVDVSKASARDLQTLADLKLKLQGQTKLNFKPAPAVKEKKNV